MFTRLHIRQTRPPADASRLWRAAVLSASILVLGGCAVIRPPASRPPLADVHLHYNWDQEGVTGPKEAVDGLVANNVRLAVVTSTPPELALELRRAGGAWVAPLFTPYLAPGRQQTWFNDPEVVPAARAALAGGNYFGIGELHLVAGVGPNPKRPHPVLDGLMELARQFDVPVLLHTETSSYRFFLPLCKHYPAVRILWAHAGGILPAAQVDNLMAACPNVWTELSARDNDRYVITPIVNEAGSLLPQWAALVKRYPDRFMIGSDPVWPVFDRHRWDEPDTGWEHLTAYLDFHRRWLADLPEPLARRIRLDNAVAFFRVGTDPRLMLRVDRD